MDFEALLASTKREIGNLERLHGADKQHIAHLSHLVLARAHREKRRLKRQASKHEMPRQQTAQTEQLEQGLLQAHATSLTSARSPTTFGGGYASKSFSQRGSKRSKDPAGLKLSASKGSIRSRSKQHDGQTIDRHSRAWKLSPGERLRVGQPLMLGLRGSFRRSRRSMRSDGSASNSRDVDLDLSGVAVAVAYSETGSDEGESSGAGLGTASASPPEGNGIQPPSTPPEEHNFSHFGRESLPVPKDTPSPGAARRQPSECSSSNNNPAGIAGAASPPTSMIYAARGYHSRGATVHSRILDDDAVDVGGASAATHTDMHSSSDSAERAIQQSSRGSQQRSEVNVAAEHQNDQQGALYSSIHSQFDWRAEVAGVGAGAGVGSRPSDGTGVANPCPVPTEAVRPRRDTAESSVSSGGSSPAGGLLADMPDTPPKPESLQVTPPQQEPNGQQQGKAVAIAGAMESSKQDRDDASGPDVERQGSNGFADDQEPQRAIGRAKAALVVDHASVAADSTNSFASDLSKTPPVPSREHETNETALAGRGTEGQRQSRPVAGESSASIPVPVPPAPEGEGELERLERLVGHGLLVAQAGLVSSDRADAEARRIQQARRSRGRKAGRVQDGEQVERLEGSGQEAEDSVGATGDYGAAERRDATSSQQSPYIASESRAAPAPDSPHVVDEHEPRSDHVPTSEGPTSGVDGMSGRGAAALSSNAAAAQMRPSGAASLGDAPEVSGAGSREDQQMHGTLDGDSSVKQKMHTEQQAPDTANRGYSSGLMPVSVDKPAIQKEFGHLPGASVRPPAAAIPVPSLGEVYSRPCTPPRPPSHELIGKHVATSTDGLAERLMACMQDAEPRNLVDEAHGSVDEAHGSVDEAHGAVDEAHAADEAHGSAVEAHGSVDKAHGAVDEAHAANEAHGSVDEAHGAVDEAHAANEAHGSANEAHGAVDKAHGAVDEAHAANEAHGSANEAHGAVDKAHGAVDEAHAANEAHGSANEAHGAVATTNIGATEDGMATPVARHHAPLPFAAPRQVAIQHGAGQEMRAADAIPEPSDQVNARLAAAAEADEDSATPEQQRTIDRKARPSPIQVHQDGDVPLPDSDKAQSPRSRQAARRSPRARRRTRPGSPRSPRSPRILSGPPPGLGGAELGTPRDSKGSMSDGTEGARATTGPPPPPPGMGSELASIGEPASKSATKSALAAAGQLHGDSSDQTVSKQYFPSADVPANEEPRNLMRPPIPSLARDSAPADAESPASAEEQHAAPVQAPTPASAEEQPAAPVQAPTPASAEEQPAAPVQAPTPASAEEQPAAPVQAPTPASGEEQPAAPVQAPTPASGEEQPAAPVQAPAPASAEEQPAAPVQAPTPASGEEQPAAPVQAPTPASGEEQPAAPAAALISADESPASKQSHARTHAHPQLTSDFSVQSCDTPVREQTQAALRSPPILGVHSPGHVTVAPSPTTAGAEYAKPGGPHSSASTGSDAGVDAGYRGNRSLLLQVDEALRRLEDGPGLGQDQEQSRVLVSSGRVADTTMVGDRYSARSLPGHEAAVGSQHLLGVRWKLDAAANGALKSSLADESYIEGTSLQAGQRTQRRGDAPGAGGAMRSDDAVRQASTSPSGEIAWRLRARASPASVEQDEEGSLGTAGAGGDVAGVRAGVDVGSFLQRVQQRRENEASKGASGAVRPTVRAGLQGSGYSGFLSTEGSSSDAAELLRRPWPGLHEHTMPSVFHPDEIDGDRAGMHGEISGAVRTHEQGDARDHARDDGQVYFGHADGQVPLTPSGVAAVGAFDDEGEGQDAADGRHEEAGSGSGSGSGNEARVVPMGKRKAKSKGKVSRSGKGKTEGNGMVSSKRKKRGRRFKPGSKEQTRRGAAQQGPSSPSPSGVAALVEDDRSRIASGRQARRFTTSRRVPVQMPRKRVPPAGYAARAGVGAARVASASGSLKVKALRQAGARSERPARTDELNR